MPLLACLYRKKILLLEESMAQVIAFAVAVVLFTSFVISFVLARSKSPNEHLFWDSCPDSNRLFYIVSSNVGAATSLFVFICGFMLVAFSYGSLTAFGMLVSIILVYAFLRFAFVRAVRRTGSVWQKKIEAWEEGGMRPSIVGIIWVYFGGAVATLFVLVVLIFVVLALASEVVLFQIILTTAFAAGGDPSIDPVLLTFCLLTIGAVYVARGGFEAVFKTDLFQLCLVSVLLILVVGGLWTGLVSNPSVPVSRIDKVVFDATNFVLPIRLGWWVLAVFFFIAFSYCVGGIDQWTRSLLFAKNPRRTERAFKLTGILFPLYSFFAIYLGLYLRLHKPLREEFLTLYNDVWSLRSFQNVTQLPSSASFIQFLASWPQWVILVVWMGVTAMALTTIDSLLLIIPQVCRQYSLMTDGSDEKLNGIVIKRLHSLILRCANSPRRTLVAGAGVVAIIASSLSQRLYAVSGLWGWSFQFLAAAMIVGTFIAKRETIERAERSILRLLKVIIMLWFGAAVLNFVLSIMSEKTPTILLPSITVIMGVVVLGLAIYYDRRKEESKAKRGECDD
jgi:Na+/proline symporter